MNYMPEIAKMLGVEIGEKFKICEHNGNTYTLTEDGLYYYENGSNKLIRSCLFEKLITDPLKIIKIPKSILTNKEKEDLSVVIRPFRDRVDSLYKTTDRDREYIVICTRDDTESKPLWFTDLPTFKAGTMYKGMELDKDYSLSELGL